MKLEIQFDEDGVASGIPVMLGEGDKVEDVIARIESQIQIDGTSILELALESDAALNPSELVRALEFKHTSLRVRRVCVEVHFESEEERHNFPAVARWSRVHRWACRHFKVAHDACANLELHAGTTNGPALNERKEIGRSEECQVVWLVKPGPEPNGHVE